MTTRDLSDLAADGCRTGEIDLAHHGGGDDSRGDSFGVFTDVAEQIDGTGGETGLGKDTGG